MRRTTPAFPRQWLRLAAILFVAVTWALPATAAQVLPEGVDDQSYTLAGGERVLQLSATFDAPLARVWAAFATEEGFKAWAVPLARIDLRVGGSIESSYDAKVPLGSGNTIRNEIIALVPQRLLVMRNVQAPPGVPFDVGVFQSTQTAMWFEALDARRTRLTLVNGRFFEGAKFDGVYQFFLAGNAYTLGELQRHLARGTPDR